MGLKVSDLKEHNNAIHHSKPLNTKDKEKILFTTTEKGHFTFKEATISSVHRA